MENPPPTQELDAYRSYYDNKGQSDVVFVVGPSRFNAHKDILCQRSPYFARQLAEVLDLVQMDIEIEIRDCSDRIFQKVQIP
jgi:hypothetical protein